MVDPVRGGHHLKVEVEAVCGRSQQSSGVKVPLLAWVLSGSELSHPRSMSSLLGSMSVTSGVGKAGGSKGGSDVSDP